jgi:hypothetical protein
MSWRRCIKFLSVRSKFGVEVDERVGILVCNGHAAGHNTPSNQNPHALWQGSSQNRSVTITGSSNSCIWM